MREAFCAFVRDAAFPCVGARAALRRDGTVLHVYDSLGPPRSTVRLARDLTAFAESCGESTPAYTSFVAIFERPTAISEIEFEERLWRQLGALHAVDPDYGRWDPSVSSDPADPTFSFSFAGKAFFVVGLHSRSSRLARRFQWPVLVFNRHDQFERLRQSGRYGRIQQTIRARDLALQGTINPMIGDFGTRSEARQYSGRQVGDDWVCPFHGPDAGR